MEIKSFLSYAIIIPAVLLFSPLHLSAQQASDTSFKYDNPSPAFAEGKGPQVCIDEAHHNFHTANGRFKPLADLLRGDGYVVTGFAEQFTEESLAMCDLLVISNALAEQNEEDWSYPHESAFSGNEMQELMQWIRSGGTLLQFADHAPLAGAASDLGAVLGVIMMDVYVDGGPGADIFRIQDNTLIKHPILQGRTSDERVDSLVTFTGQAFQITEGWQPLIRFGPEARAFINLSQTYQEGNRPDWPSFSVAGWVHGAAREWEQGRIVLLGEAAMCTAQSSGAQRLPMGMNHPLAAQNALFCLNAVRWLTDLIP